MTKGHLIPPKKNEGCTVIKQRPESARIVLGSYHNVPLSQWLPARPESARPFAIPRSRPVSRTSCPASFSEGGFNQKGGPTFGTGRTAVNEWKDDTHIIDWYKGVKEREKKAKLVIQRAAIKDDERVLRRIQRQHQLEANRRMMDPESAASIAYAELHPDKRKGGSAVRSSKPSALDAMQSASQKTVLGGQKEGNKGSHSTSRAQSAHNPSTHKGHVKTPIRGKTPVQSAPATPAAGLGGTGFHVQEDNVEEKPRPRSARFATEEKVRTLEWQPLRDPPRDKQKAPLVSETTVWVNPGLFRTVSIIK